MLSKLFINEALSFFPVLFSLLLLVTSGQALAASDTVSNVEFTPNSPFAGQATIDGRYGAALILLFQRQLVMG